MFSLGRARKITSSAVSRRGDCDGDCDCDWPAGELEVAGCASAGVADVGGLTNGADP